MKIAFVTESGFKGKITRNFTNCRTEYAWQIALDADHYPINDLPINYDLVIVILPKKNLESCLGIIDKLKSGNVKVAVMQEGPHWYFQDYPLQLQIEYINMLVSSNIIFVHNKIDKTYYEGLTNHPDVRIMQSLMIEDCIDPFIIDTESDSRKDIIIGGNFTSWYNGMDSFSVATDLADGTDMQIYAPSMGRRIANEEQLVKHLPYTDWTNWITQLSKFKYAIHLMRTHAAGTFALNCARLSIPCIGYFGLDTQGMCHPNLTVSVGDLFKAKQLANKLKTDKLFYTNCAKECRKNYNKYFTEATFLELFEGAEIFKNY